MTDGQNMVLPVSPMYGGNGGMGGFGYGGDFWLILILLFAFGGWGGFGGYGGAYQARTETERNELRAARNYIRTRHFREALTALSGVPFAERDGEWYYLHAIACYNLGAEWVDELVDYIYGNVQYVKSFIAENLPKAKVVDPDGTYLLWVDFSGYGISPEELEHRILDKAKLWLDAGGIFGPETALFERFNLACPRSVVEEVMQRLKQAFDSHLSA